ncbi:MAG: hypothetical protein ACXVCD_19310, partial [Pseudobdellovibrionaceae bacterium]
CCRDIDWKASKANTWHWAEFANLSDLILSGVGPQDAVNIVNLWLKFGEDAAGSLYGLDSKEAAERLMEAAHSEATKGEGALIGAMLKVRYGKLLREHVKALLGRLEKRKIPGGASLLDAFCYVAAMHSEGLMYLSRPVLAEALGCPLECLNSHVMVPLGMEAATSSDGQFILTRHKSLAELSVELMQEVFQVNFDQIYYDLINAAMSAKSSNFIPLLPQWLYSYADHFDKKGRIDLAIRYGNRVLEMVPNNSSLIVNISRIYRDSGDIFKAVDLFRNYKSNVFEPRGYFVEWGAAEGLYGSYYQSICLLFYSISDQASKSPPTKQAALRFFNILNEYFIEIDKKYIANEFHQARKQSQYFKKILLLARNIERSIEDKEVSDLSFSDSMIETTKQTDISDEFDNLIKNFHFTLLYFDHETDFDFVKGKSPSDLTFICLLRLLKSAIDKNASHSGAAIQECKSE